jgi:hypothetical protein
MASDKHRSPRLRRALGELSSLALPGLIAAGLLFALPADTRSQGERPARKESSDPPPLCGEWHRGAGETTPLDLGEIKRAYAGLKTRLSQDLARESRPAMPDLDRPYEAGLPACREDQVRTEPLSQARGARFRGKSLFFLSTTDPGRLSLPPEVERTPGAEILLLGVKSLRDLPEIARRLGRPVSLASAEFARALGVRCANTWVRISEKGDTLELHEMR